MSNISDKDKRDWQTFISGKDKLPNKDLETRKNNTSKTKSIDLHGYTLENANRTLEKLIKESYASEVRKLIVVTGKGLHSNNQQNPYISKDLGILKHSVPEFIRNNHDLIKIIDSIQDAKIEDGGSGAFYIYLKKKK